MSKTPLLIYSDCPEGVTGLGRICRDLAWHIHGDPKTSELFEVGTYGFGSVGSRQFPWQQYVARNLDCVNPDLKRVWEDFSQGREGILMPIMPPSWLFGLVHPDITLQENPTVADTIAWLKTKPFQIWPYLAIESCGPRYRFNAATISTIVQCAKPLFYSRFGQKVAENSQIFNVPFIHHGIYTDKFKPADPETVGKIREETLHCNKDTIVVGCCATNTGRKRFGLLFAAFAEYQSRYNRNSKLWIHTNKLVDCWNLRELAIEYGYEKGENIAFSLSSPACTDEWMRNFYSSCDVTILPTYGEGFGYPIVESQACGTPCISGSLACEAEVAEWVMNYASHEVEGVHNLLRPHYNHSTWASCIDTAVKTELPAKYLRDQWSWEKQWPKFREWLLK